MKTLKTIQTISKIGRILSMIVFVFCIVGFCCCVIGITGLAMGLTEFKLGDVTLRSIIQNEAGVSDGTLYTAMAAGIVLCAGECVLAKFAANYFKRELQDGTPFTLGGAKELMRVGILAICIPIVTRVLAEIVYLIMKAAMTDVDPLELSDASSVSLGVMMIVASLLCKYGAELNEQKKLNE